MEKAEISIIVPIYNMEMYLEECLDSIKNQTYSKWECILVDDGSSDRSPEICDEFARKDSRFKVIHKENGGLSSARNAALAIAEGTYIGFVDADDWIEPEMFQRLYTIIIEHNADIAQVGFWKEYRKRRSIKHLTLTVKTIDGEKAMQDIGYDRLPNYVWNKLHRRSIITCGFPEGRNFEDIFVYGEWLKNISKMVLDPTLLYHYRMRKGSIIHTNPSKNRYDFFLSCIDRMKMIEKSFNSSKDINHQNAYLNKSAVSAAKIIARQVSDPQERIEAIRRVCDRLKEYPLPSIIHMNPKIWLRAKLLRSRPILFSKIMRAVHIFDFDTKSRQKRLYE